MQSDTEPEYFTLYEPDEDGISTALYVPQDLGVQACPEAIGPWWRLGHCRFVMVLDPVRAERWAWQILEGIEQIKGQQ